MDVYSAPQLTIEYAAHHARIRRRLRLERLRSAAITTGVVILLTLPGVWWGW